VGHHEFLEQSLMGVRCGFWILHCLQRSWTAVSAEQSNCCPNTDGEPTGVVFNGVNSSFVLPGGPTRFIFATEGGAIAAWNGGGSAITQKAPDDNTSYKGLAIGGSGAGDTLYATDFKGGKIDVFNNSFQPTSLSGNFTDPSLPSGFTPFNIQNLGNKLYVTYAVPDADREDDVAGPGNGLVDIFNLDGGFEKRLISGGALNSPWGLAIAPDSFGPFAGDLLVGNFGDGRINVYDPSTGAWIDVLKDTNGNPIEIEGLWGLRVGNGGNGGSLKDVFFTAGIAGPNGEKEDHGLFGALAPVPDAGASTGLLLGVTVIGTLVSRRKA
jgi:uncharacterized protein (TIGR03118 family)